MAELNLKQIIDRLNAEFTGETRKLVFWYDDKAEFAEDMEPERPECRSRPADAGSTAGSRSRPRCCRPGRISGGD